VPVNEAALAEIADGTGGDFFEAATTDELTAIYTDIGSAVATEQARVNVGSWFAGRAMLLILARIQQPPALKAFHRFQQRCLLGPSTGATRKAAAKHYVLPHPRSGRRPSVVISRSAATLLRRLRPLAPRCYLNSLHRVGFHIEEAGETAANDLLADQHPS
jgi:hypothetical protein